MRNIDIILDAIKKYKNISSDLELANLLGVKANTVSTWRSRKTIPYKKLIAFANSENLDINDITDKDISVWNIKPESQHTANGAVVAEREIVPYSPYSQEEQQYMNKLVAILRGKNKKNVSAIKENIDAFYFTRDIEIPGEFKKANYAG